MGEFREAMKIEGLVMRGYEGETLGIQASYTKPETTGNWHISGRAAVEDDPVRQSIKSMLDEHPEIEAVVLVGSENGLVYTR